MFSLELRDFYLQRPQWLVGGCRPTLNERLLTSFSPQNRTVGTVEGFRAPAGVLNPDEYDPRWTWRELWGFQLRSVVAVGWTWHGRDADRVHHDHSEEWSGTFDRCLGASRPRFFARRVAGV